MKDAIKAGFKSFGLGVLFAVGFFAACHFTADAEDLTAEAEMAEYAMYLQGLQDGAREASKSWKTCLFTDYRGGK